MVLESKGDTTLQLILSLLKSLFDSSVITLDQMRRVRCHLLATHLPLKPPAKKYVQNFILHQTNNKSEKYHTR